jgi:hypothetical protein
MLVKPRQPGTSEPTLFRHAPDLEVAP